MPGKLLSMEAETIAHAVEHRADHPLRRGIPAANPGHIPASSSFAEAIHASYCTSLLHHVVHNFCYLKC